MTNAITVLSVVAFSAFFTLMGRSIGRNQVRCDWFLASSWFFMDMIEIHKAGRMPTYDESRQAVDKYLINNDVIDGKVKLPELPEEPEDTEGVKA